MAGIRAHVAARCSRATRTRSRTISRAWTGRGQPARRVPQPHFSRLHVIRDLVYQGPPQIPDPLTVAHLIFTASFDGAVDRFLQDLAGLAATRPRRSSSHGRLPGDWRRAAFARTSSDHQTDNGYLSAPTRAPAWPTSARDCACRRALAELVEGARAHSTTRRCRRSSAADGGRPVSLRETRARDQPAAAAGAAGRHRRGRGRPPGQPAARLHASGRGVRVRARRRTPRAAGEWLRGLLDEVMTAELWQGAAPETTVNLSFTYPGLAALGVSARC